MMAIIMMDAATTNTTSATIHLAYMPMNAPAVVYAIIAESGSVADGGAVDSSKFVKVFHR